MNNDEPVLGRGLESLIPQRGPSSAGNASGDPNAGAGEIAHGTSDATPHKGDMADKQTEPESFLLQGDAHAPTLIEADPHHDSPVARAAAQSAEPAAAPMIFSREPLPENPHLRPAPAFAEATVGKPDGQASAFVRDSKYPDAIFQIETEKIVPNPDQPRRSFDEQGIKELAASIREFGLLQPLVVTKIEHEVPTGTAVEYQLISGERRLMAAKLLGLPRVPAIIRNLTYNRESLELAVIENIQREDLNPIELARAYARLQDEFRLTQREIASRLGKSREVVGNAVRLLDLPANIQEALQENQISESHGRLLLTIDDQALQQKLFRDLIENRLTTRELQTKTRAGRPKRETVEARSEHDAALSPELRFLQEKLSSELGAPVSIRQSGESGRITINFYSAEELQNILNRLGQEGGGP